MTTHCHQPSNSYSISLSHFCRHGMSLYSYSSWNCSLTGRASQILYPCLDIQLPSPLTVTPVRLVTCKKRPSPAPAAERLQSLVPQHYRHRRPSELKQLPSPRGSPGKAVPVSPAYLHGGKALLRPVLDGAPAALGQVPSPVLGLWLHHDLQLLPLTLSRVLTTQHWGLLPSSSLLVL